MKKTIITTLVFLFSFQIGRIIARVTKGGYEWSTFDILCLVLLIIGIAVYYWPKRRLV